MPWKAKGKDIVRADTGKVVGHSSSHAMAERAVAARYAHSKEDFGNSVEAARKRGREIMAQNQPLKSV